MAAHPHYAAAKAGLVGLIQTLAVEYGPDGITANAVAPGVIETPQAIDPVNSLGPDGVAATAPKVPLRRVGQPEDIAYLYHFLASEESSYVSGQLIVADGARSPRRPGLRAQADTPTPSPDHWSQHDEVRSAVLSVPGLRRRGSAPGDRRLRRAPAQGPSGRATQRLPFRS